MNMNRQRVAFASVRACGPCILLHRHCPSLPSAHHKTVFSLSHEVFYSSSQKEKQKMLGANGDPTISPHNPLRCPFAIDQILSTLQFSMQAKNKGVNISCTGAWRGDKKGQQLKRRAFWFYPASTANNHHGRAKLPRSMIEWATVREGRVNLLRWQGKTGIYALLR